MCEGRRQGLTLSRGDHPVAPFLLRVHTMSFLSSRKCPMCGTPNPREIEGGKVAQCTVCEHKAFPQHFLMIAPGVSGRGHGSLEDFTWLVQKTWDAHVAGEGRDQLATWGGMDELHQAKITAFAMSISEEARK